MSSRKQSILMSALWSMDWEHGHEHPWNTTVKLDRMNVEISVGSLLRNGEKAKMFLSRVDPHQRCLLEDKI